MQDTPRRETLTKQITRKLVHRISSGDYNVGDKLPSEQELIGEFAVSRTVIREAVASLRAAGLVSTHHGIGAFIIHRPTNPPFSIDSEMLGMAEEVIAALELRIALESEAAALAAARRDDATIARLEENLERMKAVVDTGEDTLADDLEFHRIVAEATGNVHFVNLFNYLGEMVIPRARLQTFTLVGLTRTEYLARILNEHHQIAAAIIRQDVEGSRAAMRVHLVDSRERLRKSL